MTLLMTGGRKQGSIPGEGASWAQAWCHTHHGVHGSLRGCRVGWAGGHAGKGPGRRGRGGQGENALYRHRAPGTYTWGTLGGAPPQTSPRTDVWPSWLCHLLPPGGSGSCRAGSPQGDPVLAPAASSRRAPSG